MSHWKPDTPSAWAGFQPLAPGHHDHKPDCHCQEKLLTRIKRRDWEAIINALGVAGCSQHDIAKHLGVHRSTVVGWHRGGEPKESDARRVLALYRRHIGEI